MKKMLISLSVLALFAGMAVAGMDDVTITISDLAQTKAQTNTFVARGYVEAIEVYCVDHSSEVTGTVTITTSTGGETLFSKACTAAVTRVYPNIQMQDIYGTGLSDLTQTNTLGNIQTNKLYMKIPVADTIKTVLAASGGGTNDYKIKFIYWK